ncbi:MAG: VOC family protein [Actinobacteria bacterium]|nr:VOC family protein [Actinomycetota bacterium]
MGVQLAKQAIDLGIVIRDSEASLRFYRDTLGFDHVADIPMPLGGGGTMHRLQCGETLVKLVKFDEVPPAANPPGGLSTATGFRYFTMIVTNLAEMMQACEAAGYKVVVSTREARPGVTIGMVEDPDGNWVEFVQNG